MRYLDFGAIKEEILTPEEFLNLSDEDKENIEWVEPEHKRLRISTDIGGLRVYYKKPIFKYLNEGMPSVRLYA